MKTSEQTAEIFAALAKVTGQLKNPSKSATAKAGSYSYGYAPLDKIVEDARAALADQGMACIQELTSDLNSVGVITRLTHASGQWVELGPFWLPGGAGAQQYGSAATYARRYALSAALLIAAEEDDDAATVKQKTERRTRQARDLKSQADAAVTSGEGIRVPAPFPSPDLPSGGGHGLDDTGSEEAGGAEAGEGNRETTGTPSSASLAEALDEVDDRQGGGSDEEPWNELVERAQAMQMLLAVTDGNLTRAVTLVNKFNRTSFTKKTLGTDATAVQLYAAAEQAEEDANG